MIVIRFNKGTNVVAVATAMYARDDGSVMLASGEKALEVGLGVEDCIRLAQHFVRLSCQCAPHQAPAMIVKAILDGEGDSISIRH